MVRWMPFFRRDPPARPGGEDDAAKDGGPRLAGSRDPTEARDGKDEGERRPASGRSGKIAKPPKPAAAAPKPARDDQPTPPAAS